MIENKAPLVSVILPVYNCEKYVREAIESVLNQTFKDFELIIIDGSTDRIEEVIKPYLADKRVKYQKQIGKGCAAACNQGYKVAKGKYICFQDADDISLPTRLEEEVRILENNRDIELVFSHAIFLDDNDRPMSVWGGIGKEGVIPSKEAFYKLYVEGNFIPNPSIMFKRRHIRDKKIFSEDLKVCADFEHNLRLTHEHNIYEIARPLVKIRRGKRHKHLTALRELNFEAEKEILKRRIRREFKDKYPKVTLIHYCKAISNQLLKESLYFKDQKDTRAIKLFVKALAFNPFSVRIWYVIIMLFPKLIVGFLKSLYLRVSTNVELR